MSETTFATEVERELYEALEESLEEMKEELSCIGGCDHSVGVCCCTLIRRIDKAQAALAKARGEPCNP